jgi:hypothetical protein
MNHLSEIDVLSLMFLTIFAVSGLVVAAAVRFPKFARFVSGN